VARSESQLRALADELGGTAHPADLLDPSHTRTLLNRVEQEAGPVDVLVNNAGMGVTGAMWDSDDEVIEHTIRLNLTVPLELCRQAVPRMVSRNGGHLVNIASLAAMGSAIGMTVYASSKAGLAHASSTLRFELGNLPVRVTTVFPGPIRTDMLMNAKAYEPCGRSFERLRRLQLLPETSAASAAASIVKAVRRDRRTVWMPGRAAAMVGFVEAPRRLTEIALAGVPRETSVAARRR
jgi:short-subunit dehydrogenase